MQALTSRLIDVSALTRHLPTVALLTFGAVVLYGVGFSHSSTVHNAAHDTRHAAGFPCH
jgi:cobalt transporter subunit CbtB